MLVSSNGFVPMVQGYDSSVLQYQITEKQLEALTNWEIYNANDRFTTPL